MNINNRREFIKTLSFTPFLGLLIPSLVKSNEVKNNLSCVNNRLIINKIKDDMELISRKVTLLDFNSETASFVFDELYKMLKPYHDKNLITNFSRTIEMTKNIDQEIAGSISLEFQQSSDDVILDFVIYRGKLR